MSTGIYHRELLKLGFRVRAGVRSAQRAENLVQVCVHFSYPYLNVSVSKLLIYWKLYYAEC